MTSKTDIKQLAGEIEATQLVLVAYLVGIAEASRGGRRHIDSMFRLASKLAETTAELAGDEQQTDRIRRVQKAIEYMRALTL